MIVFFLPNLRPGGAERVMLNVMFSYHDAYPGVNVVLLLGEKLGPLLGDVPVTIPIYSLKAKSATKSIIPLISFCNKHKPRIIFSTLGSALAASVVKLLVSRKTIFINRIGNTIGAEKLLFKNTLKRYLYIQANKFIAKNSNHVIFQCNYMAKDHRKETGVIPKTFSIIYNPVQVDNVKRLADNIVNDKFTFIAVGRLNTQKGYQILITACAILKDSGKEFNLAIIGDGNLQESLQKQIEELQLKEYITLMGFNANPYPYMKQAAYVVSSSLYEGFSNVIIESLCLGTPVIATNCPGGNAEVIKEGENGRLCIVHDASNLAAVMEKSLEQNVVFSTEEIAANAQAIFNSDIIFKQYENILNRHLV